MGAIPRRRRRRGLAPGRQRQSASVLVRGPAEAGLSDGGRRALDRASGGNAPARRGRALRGGVGPSCRAGDPHAASDRSGARAHHPDRPSRASRKLDRGRDAAEEMATLGGRPATTALALALAIGASWAGLALTTSEACAQGAVPSQAAPPAAAPRDTTRRVVDETQAEIENQKKELEALGRELDERRAKSQQLRGRERNLLGDLKEKEVQLSL